MPSRIRVLPEFLVNQIAAGEVVQRPASVVKELLENALDAAATRVHLRLEDGGKALVQVLDDGCGMSPDDARLSLARHATSKLREAADLYRLATYGFRGEALAAISAVAQVTITTREATSELGARVAVEGGAWVNDEPLATKVGTSVAVKALFYNVPARRKFLKSTPIELKHCLAEVLRAALPRPQVAFRVDHGPDCLADYPAQDLPARVAAALRLKETDLIAVDEQAPGVQLVGYLAQPQLARRLRGDQYLFVNGRYIRDAALHHAITTALTGLLPAEHHPLYALYLTLDPAQVDVNIHPAKTEAKFDDERLMYALVQGGVRRAVAHPGGAALPSLTEPLPPPPPAQPAWTGLGSALSPQPRTSGSMTLADFRAARTQPEPAAQPRLSLPHTYSPPTPPDAHAPVLLAGGWLLAEGPPGLVLVNLAAAHRRVLYEKLLAAHTGAPVPSQQLLYPEAVELSPPEWAQLQPLMPVLRLQGLDLQPLPGSSPPRVLICGVPAQLATGEGTDLLQDLLSAHENATEGTPVAQRTAAAQARRLAWRPGKPMPAPEARMLLHQLWLCQEPGRDIAGGPTYRSLTPADLEALFNR